MAERGPILAPVTRRDCSLELLHPDGHAARVVVMGERARKRTSQHLSSEARGLVDLLVAIPARAEAREPEWLRSTARLIQERLASDGLAYVVVPRRNRARMTSILRRSGLRVEAAIAELPSSESPRYLVPLSRVPATTALTQLVADRPYIRRLIVIALRLPLGQALLRRSLPSVALAVRRPRSRRLFDWIDDLLPGEPGRTGVLGFSGRPDGARAVVHVFDRRGALSGTAKAGRSPEVDFSHEAEMLTRLASDVRAAGAELPRTLKVERRDGCATMLMTPVHGRSAVVALVARPRRLESLLEGLSSWLVRWNRLTMTLEVFDERRLRDELLRPAAEVAPLLADGDAYQRWLAAAGGALVGRRLPVVATHNDLTMWNVVVSRNMRLGVVDWEAARERGLPLVDLFYAAVDAVAAAGKYADRVAAFQECFCPRGRFLPLVTRLRHQFDFLKGEPASFSELCFHACWLQHAANEARANGLSPGPLSFVEIVRWLAARPRSVGLATDR